jgi:hypothetical protein
VLLNIKKIMGDVLIIEKFEEECMPPLVLYGGFWP